MTFLTLCYRAFLAHVHLLGVRLMELYKSPQQKKNWTMFWTPGHCMNLNGLGRI